MNKELDIAAILRDKPQGTKLYSPICGKLTLNAVDSDGIFCKTDNNQYVAFTNDGKYKSYGKWLATGECLLFPSKEMRDWEKFAWKKGDVLTDGKRHVIFKCWDNNDYTLFFATFEYKTYDSFRQNLVLNTNEFTKSSDNVAKIVIKKVEEHYDGKLNLETLEIEKPQFKDGDIVVLDDDGKSHFKTILLYQSNNEDKYEVYSFLNIGTMYLNFEATLMDDRKARLATDSEKQQLFDALAKVDKAWDAEKKAIVDLPKKHLFKPFDKVLVRDNKEDEWKPSFFLKEVDGAIFPYYCINDNENRKYCIPYEGNEHLLGTTDSPKEGGEK